MGWTPAPTLSCQQPDAMLWLLHQHPVNQESLIFYGERFPEVMASWGMCVCLCAPVCVHSCLIVLILIINPLWRQQGKREKSDLWSQVVHRSPSKISASNNNAIFLCYVVVISITYTLLIFFLLIVFLFLTEIICWLETPETKDQNCHPSFMTRNSTLRYFYCQRMRRRVSILANHENGHLPSLLPGCYSQALTELSIWNTSALYWM